jgi:zinc protease
MFRGTKKFPKQKYNQILKEIGADNSAFTTDDWTAYYATTSSEQLETIIELESDRFLNLEYAEYEFKKEAGSILGEYNTSASSPYLQLIEEMAKTAFRQHTYQHTTIGFLKDIQDMPNHFEYSIEFYNRYYRPENCAIIVVGDVNPEQVFRLVKEYYSAWEPGYDPRPIIPEPAQMGERLSRIKWEAPTLPYLYIGYHIPEFGVETADLQALLVISEYLFSSIGVLYQKLVVKDQVVDFIRGDVELKRDPGLFFILARVKNDVSPDSIKNVINNQIDQLQKLKIDDQLLKDVISHLRYSTAMQFTTPLSVAFFVGNFVNLSGNTSSINLFYNKFETLTPKNIQTAARKYLVPTNRSVIILEYGEGL